MGIWQIWTFWYNMTCQMWLQVMERSLFLSRKSMQKICFFVIKLQNTSTIHQLKPFNVQDQQYCQIYCKETTFFNMMYHNLDYTTFFSSNENIFAYKTQLNSHPEERSRRKRRVCGILWCRRWKTGENLDEKIK